MTAASGGYLALLALAHFVVDWGLQTHWEAMNKSKSGLVRAVHCVVYATGMIAAVALMGERDDTTLAAIWAWLWLSHFIEDTYYPVYLWARYVRRWPGLLRFEDMRTVAREPLGLLLLVTMDQVIHVMCLVPVAMVVAGGV